MKPSIRIGLYCESDVIGGAEQSMLTLASTYDGEAELIILTPSTAVLDAAEELTPNLERRRIVDARRGMTRSLLSHRHALAAARIDLLQVTLPNPFASRSALLAAYSLRLPTIAVQQLVLAARRRRGAWLVRALSAPLACTVAVGEQSADDLIDQFGLRASSIRVVHNGVSTPAPQPRPLSGPRPIIGCVARYETQKRIDRLIEAVAEIPEVQLHIVGDGSERTELARLIDQLGLQRRVTLEPWRKDARAMIASFDVFALASEAEAFPLTIVEAMLAKTPVVATEVGSVGEAIAHGETGLLVAPGDHDSLVQSLRLLLDDAELASSLASNGYQRALERFTAEIMATKYDAIWQEFSVS